MRMVRPKSELPGLVGDVIHAVGHLSCGHRASLDGKTFLVEYASTTEDLNQKLFGHGVYTCRQWLPFHLRLIADEFYS